METINDMLKRLCPNGVDYKKLGDVCNVVTGGEAPKDYNKCQDEIYRYPIWGNGIDVYGYAKEYKIDKDSAVISSIGANTGAVYYHKAFFTPIVRLKVVIPKTDNLLSKFLYYSLNSIEIKSNSSSVPNMNAAAIKKILIPVPPIEIQEEIVRILDNFTNLTAELQAELQARKEQYEYYRNNLLTFDKDNPNVKWMKMGEICNTLTGFPFDSSKFTKSGIKLMRGKNIKRGYLDFNSEDDRYWINSEGLEKYLLQEQDVVISMDGSLVGKSFGVISKEQLPLLLVQRVARIRSTKANIKYIYFYITNFFSDYVEKVKTKGAIPHISMKDINNFLIPIPPIEEQQRIVSILDKFEALVNDLSTGLPAEIAALQEQYEYYRNKLLTFERTA